MSGKSDEATNGEVGGGANGEQWPGIKSRFELVIVAARRSRQLLRGSRPRIGADPLKRRNTSVALEEVKRGLGPFSNLDEDQKPGSSGP
ncbi:MAG: DNA-directed RNA polymerase subunit omega [Pyrinomonadaceae bacterium]